MRREKMGVVLLLVVFLIFSSCRTPAGRSAGQVIDDATITTKVKSKLLGDDFLKGLAISTKTFQGKVTLTGAVDTVEQKERSGSIARSVYGVVGVNNLLEIKEDKI
ncbi:MAG: BON domain-containing protein [Deltaproteobacteria bacterium]|nr:BON domain-containing protein [Deltaproteobacteria bacterium]